MGLDWLKLSWRLAVVSLTQSQASQANECGLVATIVRVVRVVRKADSPASTERSDGGPGTHTGTVSTTHSQKHNRIQKILIRYTTPRLLPGFFLRPARDKIQNTTEPQSDKMPDRESAEKGSRHDHDKENWGHYLRIKCLFVMLLQIAISVAQPAVMERRRDINIILYYIETV